MPSGRMPLLLIVKPGQLDLANSLLLVHEELLSAVDLYGWGTGILIVTNLRVACLDVGWILRRRSVISFPLARVGAIQSVDLGRDWVSVSSRLTVEVNGEAKKFRFPGGTTAEQVHNLLVEVLGRG